MNDKTRLIAAVTANGIIIILELIGLIVSTLTQGFEMFQFYTQDSNYFTLGASVCYEIFAVLKLAGKSQIPTWVSVLRYMSTCCLMLTFTVVVFVLIPLSGWAYADVMLFSGNMLYHHTLCPVLAAVSLLVFENETKIEKKYVWLSMIPTCVYAVIVIVLNAARVLKGPYPFLYVYEQPLYMSVVWVFVILGMALLFSWIVWLAKSKIQAVKEKKIN